jgi:hypothetical protein
MAPRSGDEPKHDFPARIGQPATRALAAAGYTNLDQLSRVTESELLKLHGMGPKALGIIRGALHTKGLSFADADKA